MLRNPSLALLLVVLSAVVLGASASVARPGASPPPERAASSKKGQRFVEVAAEVGLDYGHAFTRPERMAHWASGGVAAGDVDGDGLVDLVLVRGDVGPPVLLRNRGDGSFRAVPGGAGLRSLDGSAMGPALADFTGDGLLDLVVGAIRPARPRVLVQRPAGFVDVTERGPLPSVKNTFSAAFGDLDRDGDLDLVLGHWDTECRDGCGGDHVWENVGGGFRSLPAERALPGFDADFSFTPNFADIDNDGWPDLLVAADFGDSRVFLNDRRGGWIDVTDREVITDRNGMGAAVGDYDNDGDLDWFVSSIELRESADGGNRLYRNRGDGTFEDVTTRARVRHGGWGWGACFADVNNDGWLDLFHVNGWPEAPVDASRLFINMGNGRFRERSRRLGVVDRGSGRGVVCFDYDRDGDIDLLTSNYDGPPTLFRNEGDDDHHWIGIRLRDRGANVHGVGARIRVTPLGGGPEQMRELRAGSNYLSQNPIEAHFGLGDSPRVRRLEIVWPDGERQVLRGVAADRWMTIERP